MESLDRALDGHNIVGIDSAIFIYYVEEGDQRAQGSGHVLRLIASGKIQGITSVVTLTEVATLQYRNDRPDLANEYRTLVTSLPSLAVAIIDLETALHAARLRGSYSLRTPDALQIAACLERGATAFVTNDRRLRRVPDLQVLVLDDFVDG